MKFTEYINQTKPQKQPEGSVILEENEIEYFFSVNRDAKTDEKVNILNIKLCIDNAHYYYAVNENTNFLQDKNGSNSVFKIKNDLHNDLKSRHQEEIKAQIRKYL